MQTWSFRTIILVCCYFAAISIGRADPGIPVAPDEKPATKTTAVKEGKGMLIIVSKLPLASEEAKDNWSTLLPTGEDKVKDEQKKSAIAGRPSVYCRQEDVNGSQRKVDKDFELKGQLVPCNNSRLLAGEGATIRVVYVGAPLSCDAGLTLPALEPVETERRTLLSIQVRQLLVHQFGNKSLGTEVCAWAWPDVQLTQKRAEVVVKTTDPDDAKNPVEFRVITGPKEHWFLSADVLTKGAKQLKYDFGTRAITEKEKPEQLYLGVNYMIGDVYGTLPGLDKRRVVLKALATPNKQLNSVGLGIGYRLPGKFTFSTKDVDSADHSGVVIFVARMWTKGEALSGTTVVNDGKRVASTRIGISYSIGTALSWLGPKK